MAENRSFRLVFPQSFWGPPADLTAVVVVTALINVAVFMPIVRETPLRVPLGIALVLFVPGYVFVAALFPEAGPEDAKGDSLESDAGQFETDDEAADWNTPCRSQIDRIERLALSFGLSVAIAPLIGLVLNFTPWGIRLIPIMIAVSGFTLVATVVAAVRRWNLPEDERFSVPYHEWVERGRAELLEPDSRADAVLNVLLVVSILIAGLSVGYAVMLPPQGESFSAIYLLNEDNDGELVADDYPTEFELGENHEVIVGIDNHEHQPTDYTVVVVEQDTEVVENDTVVTDQRELDRFETHLEHNETWTHTHDLEPTMTGENVRIVWLLYPENDVPADPSIENTAYHVHLWVDVAEAEADDETERADG
ncbi:DUF1616 domain-containing protein [Natronococcus sp. A-GB1]|uniref:DUF1616 domain-containing protein n=1 Tax=Natronococcus sp. A-GB1 TaxID=3037648 RepID=UPI00241CCF40|nr:DUF1616 domain-containing protein [Natronococcus sp. A-GB1]MDG5761203.1 DUF1616 domain-containing protein [Natronococcus sp. A-GB1]